MKMRRRRHRRKFRRKGKTEKDPGYLRQRLLYFHLRKCGEERCRKQNGIEVFHKHAACISDIDN
jgi:hypothetical protein